MKYYCEQTQFEHFPEADFYFCVNDPSLSLTNGNTLKSPYQGTALQTMHFLTFSFSYVSHSLSSICKTITWTPSRLLKHNLISDLYKYVWPKISNLLSTFDNKSCWQSTKVGGGHSLLRAGLDHGWYKAGLKSEDNAKVPWTCILSKGHRMVKLQL